jgi:predicted SAM-dependent methyltransferase
MRRILHAGAGSGTMRDLFNGYQEIRLDIDPAVKPDIVANITDMGEIGQYEAVYCAHCLEHLYPHELPLALREFRRVLVPGNLAFIIVPDLEGIQPTEDVVYKSVDGDLITGLDMFFGCRKYIEKQPQMAHHNGFVKATLERAILEAGFTNAGVKRHEPMFELLAVATT